MYSISSAFNRHSVLISISQKIYFGCPVTYTALLSDVGDHQRLFLSCCNNRWKFLPAAGIQNSLLSNNISCETFDVYPETTACWTKLQQHLQTRKQLLQCVSTEQYVFCNCESKREADYLKYHSSRKCDSKRITS